MCCIAIIIQYFLGSMEHKWLEASRNQSINPTLTSTKLPLWLVNGKPALNCCLIFNIHYIAIVYTSHPLVIVHVVHAVHVANTVYLTSNNMVKTCQNRITQFINFRPGRFKDDSGATPQLRRQQLFFQWLGEPNQVTTLVKFQTHPS